MINTLKRAATLCVAAGGSDIRSCGTGICASAEPRPSATRSNRNAARITWRIAPAFRRAARRRCNACRRTCRASRRAARARWRPCDAGRKPKAESAPAAPKTESAPAAAASRDRARQDLLRRTAAAGTAGKKPSSAQISAIRSACRSDYPKVCAGVPTGGAPALQCLEKNKAKLSAGCEKAVAAASGGGAAPAAGGAPAAAATAAPSTAAPAAPAVIVLRPMRPREELFVLRSACGGDVRSLCGGVAPGGGRIVQCLAAQAASISPACKDVLAQFAAQ